MESSTISATMAEWAAGLKYEQISEEAVRESVSVAEEEGGSWRLEIAKGFPCEVGAEGGRAPAPSATRVALLVTNDSLGPQPELGRILIRSFLSTLTHTDAKPSKILFLNRGVFLTTEGSEALDVLGELQGAGVDIFTCGTCLEFFSMKEALRVGQVSNMYDTVETLTGACRTVTLA